ncbi:MAG TPA: hypothetical protein VIM43_07370 [Rugosibacter sp.]
MKRFIGSSFCYGNDMPLYFWIASNAVRAETLPVGQAVSNRPNSLIIVANDLGYSGLDAFGEEIDTPNIDALTCQ